MFFHKIEKIVKNYVEMVENINIKVYTSGVDNMQMLNYNLRFWFAKLNSWESIWDKYKCYQLRF